VKLVITGAGGLLGSALVKRLEGHELYSFYSQHPPQSGRPVHVDLLDQGELTRRLLEIRPDAIVHAAAMTDVDRCERERDRANAVNHEATKAIARCASEMDSFLVYVSTDYVFDGRRGMYREDDGPSPVNFYGMTKLMGEQAVRELTQHHLVVRTSVIYGSTPSSGKTNFALWVLESLKEGRPVSVAADQFVSPTLNTGLAEMVIECLESRLTGTLHLAGATRLSRFEFALELCRTWSLDSSLIKPVSMNDMDWQAQRPRDSSLDVSKAANILKNRPLAIHQALSILKRQLEGSARAMAAR